MKEDLLKIINTYGVMPQLEYYQTEVWELNEAIIRFEEAKINYFEGYGLQQPDLEKHIVEEIADNYVMLYQFKEYYNLDFKLVKDIIVFDSEPLKYLKIFFKDVHKLGRKIIEIENLKETMIYDKIDLNNLLQMVLYELRQFQYYYGISDKEIEEIMKYKINRQLERIERGE